MDNIEQIIAQFKKQLDSFEKRLIILEERISSKKKGPEKTEFPKNLSLREFIAEKDPKDDVQRTLIIGYYLENNKGMSSFNIEDIKKEFMTAKMKPPSNINDKINLNIRKGGLIMEAEEKKDNKKAWVLTDTGEKEVKKGFKSER